MREELFKMDAVEVYKMVLKGDVIKRFPAGFWQQPEAKQNASKCIKFLVEEILNYDMEMLKETGFCTGIGDVTKRKKFNFIIC